MKGMSPLIFLATVFLPWLCHRPLFLRSPRDAPGMKALILTPTFFPRLTGNAVTAGRITRELTEGGIECRVIDLSAVAEAEAIKTATAFGPDLVHSFHAFKTGRIGLMVKGLLGIPMITTLTGTDLHVDLRTPETRGAVLRVLAGADRLTVFNDAALRLIVREGVAPEKISVIHQSVFFPERRERDFRAELHIDRKTKVCLLMGGIRRIKNFGYAFPVLEQVRNTLSRPLPPDRRRRSGGEGIPPPDKKKQRQAMDQIPG